MNIGIDAFHIGVPGSAWGNTQLNLIKNVAAIRPQDKIIAYSSRSQIEALRSFSNVEIIRVRGTGFDNALLRERAIRQTIRDGKYRLDVYLETCEIAPKLPEFAKLYTIIHDFSQGRFEKPYSIKHLGGLIYKRMRINTINRSDLLFCNSNFTLKQLLPFLKNRQSARVFPHGCDEVFLEHASEEARRSSKISHALPKRFFLFVGRVQVPHKNVELLLRAFNVVSSHFPDVGLVIASSQKLTKTQDSILNGQRSKVIILHDLNNLQIAELYYKAIAFVFPSNYEGFGIPIIEAQNLSCPVILNDIEVFREVAGGGAIFFNGTEKDLVVKMESILDRDVCSEYVLLGLQNCRKYSWKLTAEIISNEIDKGNSR